MPQLEIPDDQIEDVPFPCGACGVMILTKWMRNNTGLISSPDYVLAGEVFFHPACWDDLLRRYPLDTSGIDDELPPEFKAVLYPETKDPL